MTVVYAQKVQKVSNISSRFGNLWKILFLWKGSVYKLVYADLLLWLTLYATISLTRRLLLDEAHQAMFDQLCAYCTKFSELIPLSFVLGFYVALVVNRWWIMWDMLPWPDDTAMFVTAVLRGQDERARLMRRTIMRYVNLAGVHTMALFSSSVRRRFPTLDHLVAAGLLEEGEKQIFEDMSGRMTKLYWMPLVWATSIVVKARREKIIEADVTMKTIIDHLTTYRKKCEKSLQIEVINVPLVYTQVVTLAVYAFFASTLFSRQFVNEMAAYDSYVPVFTILQFLFYMGWLKVAETLLNPYGDDDDDFELNWLIDRHLQVSYMIVDEMHAAHPELVRDAYWDEILPDVLPFGDAVPVKIEPPPFAGSFRDLTSRSKLLMAAASGAATPHTPDSNFLLVPGFDGGGGGMPRSSSGGGGNNPNGKFPDFPPPSVILKRPPLYKRFLSNIGPSADEERGSRGAGLHKRDPISVSMQDCKVSPLPKRSTTVSDKMYRYFQDKSSSGSRQYLAPNDASNMPLTTVMEDESDQLDAKDDSGAAVGDVDASSELLIRTDAASTGAGDVLGGAQLLPPTPSPAVNGGVQFVFSTSPPSRCGSDGSSLADYLPPKGFKMMGGAAGNGNPAPTTTAPGDNDGDDVGKGRTRTVSAGVVDDDQPPGIFLVVPSLPRLQDKDRDGKDGDKGAA